MGNNSAVYHFCHSWPLRSIWECPTVIAVCGCEHREVMHTRTARCGFALGPGIAAGVEKLMELFVPGPVKLWCQLSARIRRSGAHCVCNQNHSDGWGGQPMAAAVASRQLMLASGGDSTAQPTEGRHWLWHRNWELSWNPMPVQPVL